MEDVALEIHILLRLHETFIVERHTSWLAGHAACTDADKPRLRELCSKLSGYAKLVIRFRRILLTISFSVEVLDLYALESRLYKQYVH